MFERRIAGRRIARVLQGVHILQQQPTIGMQALQAPMECLALRPIEALYALLAGCRILGRAITQQVAVQGLEQGAEFGFHEQAGRSRSHVAHDSSACWRCTSFD